MDSKVGNKKNKKTGRVIAVVIALIFLLAITGFKVYVDNGYEPNHSLDEYQSLTKDEIEITDNIISIQNQASKGTRNRVGIIFYSGERINGKCYLPLMVELTNMGFNTFLPTTFGNLPILNLEGAEYVIRSYTGIRDWYIVAHGQACQIAAEYVKNKKGWIKGIIFLGGATEGVDLSDSQMEFLSIYGSNDSVINLKKLEASKKYYPDNAQYCVIEGGNFTNFADTKLVTGDSQSSITAEEQIKTTANLIKNLIK